MIGKAIENLMINDLLLFFYISLQKKQCYFLLENKYIVFKKTQI